MAFSTALFLGGCDEPADTAGTTRPSAPGPAPIVQKTQLEQAQIFSASTAVLSSLKSPEEFATVKPYNNVNLSPQPDGLRIRATGDDPALLLPAFGDAEAIVEITIHSPTDTTLQLFYRFAGQAFSQPRSIMAPIKEGRNVVYAQLPAGIGGLRLDPGEPQGDYRLESFQAKRMAVSVATP